MTAATPGKVNEVWKWLCITVSSASFAVGIFTFAHVMEPGHPVTEYRLSSLEVKIDNLTKKFDEFILSMADE